MHRLSRERIAAGKPSWAHHISLEDVFHNDDLSFTEKRDAIVARIRASSWYKGYDETGDMSEIVEDLAAATDTDEFDAAWDELYDIADADRVWIATS